MSSSSSSSSSTGGASEFEASLSMNAPADAVYDFVSDISNMPQYMPTTKKAESAGQERVRVQGGGDGFQYDSEGYLKRNDETDRLEWGADDDTYNGWMKVDDEGDNSMVTIHLTFKSDKYQDIPAEDVNQGLTAALESIKNHVEGKGGKVKPPVEN